MISKNYIFNKFIENNEMNEMDMMLLKFHTILVMITDTDLLNYDIISDLDSISTGDSIISLTNNGYPLLYIIDSIDINRIFYVTVYKGLTRKRWRDSLNKYQLMSIIEFPPYGVALRRKHDK